MSLRTVTSPSLGPRVRGVPLAQRLEDTPLSQQSAALWAAYPVTDGNTRRLPVDVVLLSAPSMGSVAFSDGGGQTVLDSFRSEQPLESRSNLVKPGFDYRVNAGWIAFTRPAEIGPGGPPAGVDAQPAGSSREGKPGRRGPQSGLLDARFEPERTGRVQHQAVGGRCPVLGSGGAAVPARSG